MNYKVTRSENYQADERSKDEDLQHFKYVDKKKVNGLYAQDRDKRSIVRKR